MPLAALTYLGAKCAVGAGALVGVLKVNSMVFDYALSLIGG
ncbi:hypothetical protein PAQ31011_00844 [Pandoraea aquatica]|uniref:Uncharacterized protein n=1 Tax=Pandoraea aquatica TaxID=2508290 RepID=A0A5E4SHK9_9BURK|nr:hypothetical protein [Pandoraea aquatica]VVD75426.1 hypothetical protein PAQ31011_00844 [Pandoraea aquatica]